MPVPTDIPAPMATPTSQVVIPHAPAIVISGLVFHDTNANGMWDATTEPGLAGVKVVIASISAGPGDSGQGDQRWMDSQTVDASGRYTFTLPGPGVYTVYPVPPPGYRYTTAARSTFSVGERDASIETTSLAFGLNTRCVVPLLLAILLGLILALLVGVTVTSMRVRGAILERSQIRGELAVARCLVEDQKLGERG